MQKKTKKNTRKLKVMGVWFIFMTIFILELFLYAWCRVQCIRGGYEISRAANQHRALITLQNNLKIELARLKSPERIAKIAQYRFGLTKPSPEQVIIIP